MILSLRETNYPQEIAFFETSRRYCVDLRSPQNWEKDLEARLILWIEKLQQNPMEKWANVRVNFLYSLR
jgi:hypothetical protein